MVKAFLRGFCSSFIFMSFIEDPSRYIIVGFPGSCISVGNDMANVLKQSGK